MQEKNECRLVFRIFLVITYINKTKKGVENIFSHNKKEQQEQQQQLYSLYKNTKVG